MGVPETAAQGPAPNMLGLELERQLHLVEKHYAEACHLAESAREELRALSIRSVPPRSAAIAAARKKFEAVVARCSRLLKAIDELERRIEAC